MLDKFILIFLMLVGPSNLLGSSDGFSLEEGNVKGDHIGFDFENLFSKDFIFSPRMIKSAELELQAESWFLVDQETGYILSEENPNEKMPIASLTKIMTAVLVLENNELDDVVTVSENAVDTFGNKRGLVAGEKITVGSLLKIMLIDSNNAAAVALAEHTSGDVETFVGMMNCKAEELSLLNTNFINPTGLDEGEKLNMSTAYDIALLADYALGENIIWDFSLMRNASVTSLDGEQTHNIVNTDQLLDEMNGVIVGGKTGYTDKAGECLLLIVKNPDNQSNIIAIVLNSEDRFGEMKKLVDWAFDVYTWKWCF